eukprot:366355-Chlamydomonas_euryale.AAC.8
MGKEKGGICESWAGAGERRERDRAHPESAVCVKRPPESWVDRAGSWWSWACCAASPALQAAPPAPAGPGSACCRCLAVHSHWCPMCTQCRRQTAPCYGTRPRRWLRCRSRRAPDAGCAAPARAGGPLLV